MVNRLLEALKGKKKKQAHLFIHLNKFLLNI